MSRVVDVWSRSAEYAVIRDGQAQRRLVPCIGTLVPSISRYGLHSSVTLGVNASNFDANCLAMFFDLREYVDACV
jgi:hypothetical protein